MEKRIMHIYLFVQRCLETLISFLKVAIKTKFIGLKFPQQTGTCIVLANGPSLRNTFESHMDLLKKHTLFCVNGFSLTPEYELLKPGNYVLLDTSFWLAKDHDGVNAMINSIISKTDWEMNLYLPFAARVSERLRTLPQKKPNINIVYFNYVVFKGFTRISHYFFAKNWAMPQSQNVVISALFHAINAGFQEVYMAGADHDWHKNVTITSENELLLTDTHFYEKKDLILYKTGTKTPLTMSELLESLIKAFTGYYIIQKYALRKGCIIYNANPNSFVDAFKRKSLENI